MAATNGLITHSPDVNVHNQIIFAREIDVVAMELELIKYHRTDEQIYQYIG